MKGQCVPAFHPCISWMVSALGPSALGLHLLPRAWDVNCMLSCEHVRPSESNAGECGGIPAAARISHPWMISRSATGSTLSSTCTTSGSSKALQTWNIPSTAAMLDRKAFPRPSPSAAPLQSSNPVESTLWSGWCASLCHAHLQIYGSCYLADMALRNSGHVAVMIHKTLICKR